MYVCMYVHACVTNAMSTNEQIDSIENNMMNYATNNQLASHELVKADNYQKKKGKWTCILLVALVIFLVIFLALII